MSQIRSSSKIESSSSGQAPEVEHSFWQSRVHPGNVVSCFGELEAALADEILKLVGPDGRLVYVNPSRNKISDLQREFKSQTNFILGEASITQSHLPKASSDLGLIISCLEFAPQPDQVVQEMHRILKPGGRIIVSEFDQHLLSHYPLAPHLEHQLQEIARELSRQQLWDPQIGRKLYSLLNEAGFQDLKAIQLASQIITGSETESDQEEWERWFQQLKNWKTEGVWHTSIDLHQFRQEFTNFFENPDRFSYSPRIVLEGIRES